MKFIKNINLEVKATNILLHGDENLMHAAFLFV